MIDDFSKELRMATQRFRFADLFSGGMGKVLSLGVDLAVLQQWSGINVIFTYAKEIFDNQ